MSIGAVESVLCASIRPPALKMTAIVLAYAHNGKTGLLNPSIAYIAGRVGIDRRQAQRYVRALIDMQIVSVIANAAGGKPGTTPHYRLDLDRLAAMAKTDDTDDTPTGGADDTRRDGGEDTPAPATGDMDDAEGRCTRRGGVVPMTQTGGVGTTLTGSKGNEPEVNRKKQRAVRAPHNSVAGSHFPEVDAQVLKDWEAVRKAKRVGTATATVAKKVRAEAAKAGLPVQEVIEICCARGWASFNASWDRGDGTAKATNRAMNADFVFGADE